MIRGLLTFPGLVFIFHFSIGQSKSDTTSVLGAVNHARKLYTQRLGDNSLLHNGVEHKHYRDEIESEAYLDQEWINGSVFYDGQLFENVPLMYDMIAQRAVTYFNGQVDIDLVTDKVEWFTIDGRKFENFGTSFYELLDSGTAKLYARRRKKIDQKVGEKQITYSVSGTVHFFLYKGGEYIPVNRKRALVAALDDKKKELKQFKRENKLRFDKENKETSIRKYVAHYNQLHQ